MKEESTIITLRWLFPACIVSVALIVLGFFLNDLNWDIRILFFTTGIFFFLCSIMFGRDQLATVATNKLSYLDKITSPRMKRSDEKTFYFTYSHWNKRKKKEIELLYSQGVSFEDNHGNKHKIHQVYSAPLSKLEPVDGFWTLGSFFFGNDCVMVIVTDGGSMDGNNRSIEFQINDSVLKAGRDINLANTKNDHTFTLNNYSNRKAILEAIEYLNSSIELDDPAATEAKEELSSLLEGNQNISRESKERVLDYLQSVSASVTAETITKTFNTVINILANLS